MDYSALYDLGFTQKEVEVYLALLENGPCPVGKIIDRVNLHKPSAYQMLNTLVAKGVVSYVISNGVREFSALKPDSFLQLLKSKENELAETVQDLEKRRTLASKKPIVTVYEGKKAMNYIGEDMLREKVNYIIGGDGSVSRILPEFWKRFNPKRIRNKVLWKDLVIKGALLEDFQGKNAKELKKQYFEHKFLPESLRSPNIITIYGNKVLQTLWVSHPIFIVIESEEIAKMYLNYFNFLWNIAEQP